MERGEHESKGKQKTVFRAFLDDFEKQQFDLSEKTKEDLEVHKRTVGTLFTLDMVICYSIIGPLVVAFWRGTWGMYDHIMDHLLFADNHIMSNIHALFIGGILTLLIDMFHHDLRERAGMVGSLRHNVTRHLFSLLWGFSDILFWKGIWDQIDHIAGYGSTQAASSLLIGLTVLLLFRRLKSALSMPLGIVVDQEAEHIHADTVLNSGPGDPVSRRIADGVSSRVMEAGVVLLWHGVWSFMDLFLEDEVIGLGLEHHEAGLASLTAGWLAGPIIILLHLPLLSLSATLTPESRLLHFLCLLFTVFNTIVTIACFRGTWHLLDVHLLPDGDSDHVTLLSLGVGWVIAFLGLLAFRCMSCLHAGAFRDSPEDGISVTFHLSSFLYLHHWEKTRH